MKLNELIERLGELGFPAIAVSADHDDTILGITVAVNEGTLRILLSTPELWEIWGEKS